jgi:hypothetical protein
MNDHPASLDRLHDLAVPPPVPWWPPTPGWWIVIGMVAAGLTVMLVKALIHWQTNRYRREALDLLDDPATPPSEWPGLIKRCALAAWRRTSVAPLTGPEWDAFFARSLRKATHPSGTGSRIEELAFAKDSDGSGLKEATRDWIKHHRRETPS